MFVKNFLNEVKEIFDNIDEESISNVISVVKDVKDSKGRIFLLDQVVVPAILHMQSVILENFFLLKVTH